MLIGQSGAVVRFDLTTGREVNRWQLPKLARVWSFAFHPDNRRVAVSYVDAEVVSIYDSENGELVAELPVGPSRYSVVAWRPDGAILAVGTSRFIQMWDVEACTKRATLEGHIQQVESLSFHPDGTLLASRSWDGVLRLLDVATGRALLQMPLLVDPQFSRDGRWLGVLQHGEDAQMLEAIAAPEYRTLGDGVGDYLEGDLSPDNRLLAVNRGDAGIDVWDLSNARVVAELPRGLPVIRPDGRELLLCNADGLHRRTMTFDRELRLGPPRTVPLPANPTRVARSRDGRMLAMVSEDEGFAWTVDLDTDSVSERRMMHRDAGYVALSPDGNWLATSGWHTNEVRLWNARTGAPAHTWQVQRASVTFTPDSRVLVLGLGHEFRFHDVTSKELVLRIRRDVAMHPGFVAFAPTAGLMALEMAPGIVHLKEIATGRTVARVEDPHGDRACWIGLTSDAGRLAVIAQYARAVHVWDFRTIRARLKTMSLDWDWPEFSAVSK